jgi:hypothetical protein
VLTIQVIVVMSLFPIAESCVLIAWFIKANFVPIIIILVGMPFCVMAILVVIIFKVCKCDKQKNVQEETTSLLSLESKQIETVISRVLIPISFVSFGILGLVIMWAGIGVAVTPDGGKYK